MAAPILISQIWHHGKGVLLLAPTKEYFPNDLVCVCVCVYVHAPWRLHLSGTAGTTRKQINDVVLKTLDSSAGSLHLYFGMQNLTFQLAALFCLHTRSGHSHDLTSIRIAFRTKGIHSPLRSIVFGTHCIVSWSAFASALTRGFSIYLGKINVTTNFSIESSPRHST